MNIYSIFLLKEDPNYVVLALNVQTIRWIGSVASPANPIPITSERVVMERENSLMDGSTFNILFIEKMTWNLLPYELEKTSLHRRCKSNKFLHGVAKLGGFLMGNLLCVKE